MYIRQQSFLPYISLALFSKETIKGNNEYYLEKALFIEDEPILTNKKIVMIHPDYYQEWSEKIIRDEIDISLIIIHGSDHYIDDNIIKNLLIIFPNTRFWIQNYVGFHHQCRLLPIGINVKFTKPIVKSTLCKISYLTYNSFAREEFYIFLNSNQEFMKKYYQVKTDMDSYLQNLSELYFTVCPMGSGFDTIRFWESIMVKTIPIVKKHEFYETLRYYYPTIPFIEVDNWSDLPSLVDSLTIEKYNELMRDFDDTCLKESYWINSTIF